MYKEPPGSCIIKQRKNDFDLTVSRQWKMTKGQKEGAEEGKNARKDSLLTIFDSPTTDHPNKSELTT